MLNENSKQSCIRIRIRIMTTNELDLSLVNIHMVLKFQSDRNKTVAARPLRTNRQTDRQTDIMKALIE
jgi:hypothetical protein